MNARRSDKTKPTGFRHLTDPEKRRFFKVAERLFKATNPKERKRLKKDLARLVFGS